MTGFVKDFLQMSHKHLLCNDWVCEGLFTECNINTYFVMTGFVKDFLQNEI